MSRHVRVVQTRIARPATLGYWYAFVPVPRPRALDPAPFPFVLSACIPTDKETKESDMRGVRIDTRSPRVTGGKGLPTAASEAGGVAVRAPRRRTAGSAGRRAGGLSLLVALVGLAGCTAWANRAGSVALAIHPERSGDGAIVRGQTPSQEPALLPLPSADPEFSDPLQSVLDRREKTRQIIRVEVEGNRTIPTRPGRPASDKEVKEDLRRLYATRWFFSVEPVFRHVDGGDVLVFRVLERPIVRHVEYRGNRLIKTKYLEGLTGLEPGSPYDVSINREAARRIAEYYREKGFADVKVRLLKGDSPQDRDVVFEIDEGAKLIVSKVSFSGNRDISSAILKTKLQTKRALLGLPFLGGVFKPETIKDDIAALHAREDRLLAAVRSERARQARTQEAVIAMLGATSFAHLIEIVRDDFLHLLDLDVVALAVENGGDARADAALGVVCLSPGTIDDVLAGESGVVVLEGEGDARLFGGAAGLVASSALVPLDLGPRAPRCLLALGAREHARFGGACGAFAFLGRALERCLASWLDLAS